MRVRARRGEKRRVGEHAECEEGKALTRTLPFVLSPRRLHLSSKERRGPRIRSKGSAVRLLTFPLLFSAPGSSLTSSILLQASTCRGEKTEAVER